MGATCTAPEKEWVEILPQCTADGINFEEKFETINGERRNTASWVPANGVVKATIFIAHGLLEHSLCYYQIAIALALDGYAVLAIDHCSHGLSSGKRTLIDDHMVLVNDFAIFCNEEREQYKGLPRFVLCHSMGTIITLVALPRIRDITAVVFSGTALVAGPGGASPFGLTFLFPLTKTSLVKGLVGFTGWIDPTGSAAPLAAEDVICDAKEIENRAKDPRRGKQFICNKTAYSVLKLLDKAKAAIPSTEVPFLAIHGREDNICMRDGSDMLYREAGTDKSQKRLEILKGFKHELMQESPPQCEPVIKMVVDYFNGQLKSIGEGSGTSGGELAVSTADVSPEV